uniref:AB hydrolase-1 domain-containing protein n=1 Tax=Picea sitchensis TaxID=3332 RepID=A9NSF2_PICSI|nr:unknown [Picea sitchensis]
MVKLDSGRLLEVLNVRVTGSGERVVVLSHGFGGDQSMWKDILPYLVPDFKVIVFDLVFAGSVDPKHFDFDQSSNSLAAYADDILAILEELKIDRCMYVGHSVSGMLGCLASIKRPELFERLILLGASPRYLNDESYEGGSERGEIDGILSTIKSNYSAWVSGFVPLLIGVDQPSIVDDLSRKWLSIKPEIAFPVAKSIFECDLRSILTDVKTPCSIIQTRKDVVVPSSVPYYMQRNLGGENNSVHILDIDGHLPQLTSTHLLAKLLTQLLAGS